jgi:hypothetical protein
MRIRSINPWLAVALWIGLIFVSIPLVRNLREEIIKIIPARAIGYAVMVVVVIVVAAALAHLKRSRAQVGVSDVAWLSGVSIVVIWWTWRLMGAPEEAVHFLEYGVLGILLYRALDHRVADWTVFVAATLAGTVVGTVDEIVQWLVPNRIFDFRDIVLNSGAVALSQVVTWRMTTRPSARVSRSSRRILCRLGAAQVLLLTFCLAATPQRVTRLAEVLPMPERIASGADVICEYGYRHAVDRRTVFRSRLDLEQLADQDRTRAFEVSGDLEARRGTENLSNPAVSPVVDPFGYEIRIHLFSRNRNLHKARETAPGSPGHRRFMTAAWRENLILENAFGQTLELSPYAWEAGRRAEVEAAQDPEEIFVSRVGAHLITGVKEGLLLAIMLVLAAVLVACDLLAATRIRRQARPE